MMTSKFVGYFLEEVSDWQKKLSTADSVITIWFEVQRTWSHLESIFIGSEDIRAQLPEHSKQFDTIDADFKVDIRHCCLVCVVYSLYDPPPLSLYLPPPSLPPSLLPFLPLSFPSSLSPSLRSSTLPSPSPLAQVLAAQAVATPNVVKATNRPRLYEDLEDIQKRLSVCEKALAEYLETKRLAFPRFYFISSADLLDILSKGNQPVEVGAELALPHSTLELKLNITCSSVITTVSSPSLSNPSSLPLSLPPPSPLPLPLPLSPGIPPPGQAV